MPKGCTKIFIDQEESGIVITYGSSINTREFYCKETQQVEEQPGKGDFSIFWDDKFRCEAIIASLESEYNGEYLANSGVNYENAIKFRNYEQYLAIRGIYEQP